MNSHRIRIAAAFLTAAFFVAAPLGAQTTKPSTNYGLTVRADRAEAVYQQSEPVPFKISLTLDKQPVKEAEVQWTINKDGMPPITQGRVKIESGGATISSKLEEAGFLLCRVTFTAPDGKAITALGGAGVDPTLINPSMPVPDDFDAFWAAQKKSLAAVPINPRLTPVKSTTAGVEAFDLQADSVGAPVSAYFAKPVGARAKSLPVILLVHGAGVRSSSLGGAVGWASQNFLAMDMNAHGIPNGKPDTFYSGLSNGDLKDYRIRGRESRDTVYFRGMFLRLVRAIDFLTSQPEWDGKVVVVSGGSQGGYQAIVAAGLDPRVTFFAPGVPAGCDHTGVILGRINGWPKFIASPSPEKPDRKIVDAVRYYDAMNFATRTKADAIFTVGYVDTVCPPTSVYAAYNNVTGKKSIHVDVDAGHTITAKAAAASRQAILDHVAAMRAK
jgi:cephalosporin-C deacetylase-like acetyl esterase